MHTLKSVLVSEPSEGLRPWVYVCLTVLRRASGLFSSCSAAALLMALSVSSCRCLESPVGDCCSMYSGSCWGAAEGAEYEFRTVVSDGMATDSDMWKAHLCCLEGRVQCSWAGRPHWQRPEPVSPAGVCVLVERPTPPSPSQRACYLPLHIPSDQEGACPSRWASALSLYQTPLRNTEVWSQHFTHMELNENVWNQWWLDTLKNT